MQNNNKIPFPIVWRLLKTQKRKRTIYFNWKSCLSISFQTHSRICKQDISIFKQNHPLLRNFYAYTPHCATIHQIIPVITPQPAASRMKTKAIWREWNDDLPPGLKFLGCGVAADAVPDDRRDLQNKKIHAFAFMFSIMAHHHHQQRFARKRIL